MPELSFVPNPILFYTLTRILRFELELELNQVPFNERDKGNNTIPVNHRYLTSETLAEILKKREMPESSTYKLIRYLEETPKIQITNSVLKNLFKLTKYKNIGGDFNEFCSIQRQELEYFPNWLQEVDLWQENEVEIDGLISSNIGKDNQSNIKRLCEVIFTESKNELLKISSSNFFSLCSFWISNQLSKDHVINNCFVSNDEILILKVINQLPFGLKGEHLHIIRSKWEEERIPIDLCIQRLFRKKFITQCGQSIELVTEIISILNTIESPTEKSVDTVLKWISDSMLSEPLIFRDFEIILILQKQDKFKLAQNLIDKHSDKFKNSGYFVGCSKILENQTNSLYFSVNCDPWYFWHLAYCYNKLGKLNEAAETINKAFIYFKSNCFDNYGLKVEHIDIFLKSFQLALEVIINFDSYSLLEGQLKAIKVIATQYLHFPRYL